MAIDYSTFFRKLVPLRLLGNASLQSTLRRVTAEVIRSLPRSSSEQNLRFFQAKLRQDLKILAVHVRSV